MGEDKVQQWGYDRWYFHHEEDIVANLNAMGRNGFNLVSVIQNINGDGAWYFFKRPIPIPSNQ